MTSVASETSETSKTSKTSETSESSETSETSESSETSETSETSGTSETLESAHPRSLQSVLLTPCHLGQFCSPPVTPVSSPHSLSSRSVLLTRSSRSVQLTPVISVSSAHSRSSGSSLLTPVVPVSSVNPPSVLLTPGQFSSPPDIPVSSAHQTCPWIPKTDPGSDPKDLDPGSVRIIDPTLTVCRKTHWDHRSTFAIWQEIHSDSRSKTPYCVGIHRDPSSDKETHIFYALF